MDKTLILFVFSGTVDLYINAIAHCFYHEKVRHLYFVCLDTSELKNFHRDTDEISKIPTNVWNEIDRRAKDSPQDNDTRLYSDIIQGIESRRTEVCNRNKLLDLIKNEISTRNTPDNLIIDLSGESKTICIDTYAAVSALGLKNLFCFELAKDPNNSKTEDKQYHKLHNGTTYRYTNIFDSPTIKQSQKMSISMVMVRKSLAIFASLSMIAIIVLLALDQGSLLVSIIGIAGSLASLIGIFPFRALRQ